MGEADVNPAQADGGAPLGGFAVQVHKRLAALIRQNLDLPPGEASGARAERLHDGLLGGEPGGKFGDPTAAKGHLLGSVDPGEEAVRVLAKHLPHAIDLDNVDADGELHAADCTDRLRYTARAATEHRSSSMTAKILDGTAIAQTILEDVRADVERLRAAGTEPGLAVVLVGEDPASASYVKGKTRDAAGIGMRAETIRRPATIAQDELLALVRELNANPRWHGFLVQMPLPPHIDEGLITASIAPEKDVDGLTPVNVGRLFRGEPALVSCTPHGVIQILMRSGYDPAGKHVVVCGRSNLVGKPLVGLLTRKGPGGNATVTVCHTGTPDLREHTLRADIVVAAMGKARAITADMVREGAVVIDVGINFIEDATRKSGRRMVGDVDFDAVKEKAAAITPVPGGVGPLTRAMLLWNTVRAAQSRPS